MPRRREGPTLNKQTGYFFANFYVGIGKDAFRYRKSLKTKDPVRAQWLWEQEYRKQWEKYYGIQAGPPTSLAKFADLIPDFVAYERDVKKAKTWKMFEQRLRHVSDAWGDITLDKVGQTEIRKLDDYLRMMKKSRSEATRNHYMGLLKTFFYWAIREGNYRGENPMKQVKPYVVYIKRREYSDDELKRIIAAAKQIEKEAAPNADILLYPERIVMLLLLTGIRLGS